MYRVIGREYVNGRPGRYIVEISRSWPRNINRIYLIGTFTSLYPGYYRLIQRRDYGYLLVKLWPDIYGYGFILDNNFKEEFDPDNPEKYCFNIPFHPDEEMCLSKLVVKKPNDPLDDIYHFEKTPFFLHKYLEKIIIRFLASKEINNVLLELNSRVYEPKTIHELIDYNMYEYHVKPDKILRYRFRFEYNDQTLFYGFNGIGSNPQPIIVKLKDIPGFNEAKWFMGTVYYQIFIDSFENGDPTNDPPVKIDSIEPRVYGYYGGDLRGVINRLNHLIDLGIETIYLTPIYQSTSYHRYDVIDYKDVDKYLGSMNDLIELINKIHENKMKIILDITMNHTSPCNPLFIEALKKGRESRYWSWFSFVEEPSKDFMEKFLEYLEPECRIREIYREEWIRDKKPFFEGFFNSWTMVKFNHENPETLDYFLDITRFWIDKGVDGFRIDVAMGIDRGWLYQYYLLVKELNEDFLVLGEVSEPPSNYTCCFDSIMDYWWRMILLNTFVYKRYDIKRFIYELNKLYTFIPYYYAVSLYNALGTHDTIRIKNLANDHRVLKLLYTLQFILPGSPAIYYGDEIGLEGGRDPDNRRPMIWDRGRWDESLYNHIKKLINIYRRYKVLRHGFYSLEIIDDKILLVKRWLENTIFYGLINPNDQSVVVRDNRFKGRFLDLYNDRDLVLNREYELEPYSYFLLLKMD